MTTLLQDTALAIRHAAKLAAQRVAEATSPEAPLRVNPLVALNPRPRPLTGRELAFVRTQKREGLTSRAARSRYSPKELCEAVARARRGRTIHEYGYPYRNHTKRFAL